MLEAASQFLEQLNNERPEVMLDLQVMEVNHTYARNIGLHVPDQFNLYNIPAAALAALSGVNLQDLANQLISSGGINQAGNQTLAALLAQLSSQQNSIFSTPLATFGGGLTLEGLSLDHLAAVLSLNESSVQSLEHVTLRASQEKEATFKLGARYPVLNASFSPISNSSAIAGVLGNQSYTAPFPSVNYEDIGLTLKAKPIIHHNSDVSLELNLANARSGRHQQRRHSHHYQSRVHGRNPAEGRRAGVHCGHGDDPGSAQPERTAAVRADSRLWRADLAEFQAE